MASENCIDCLQGLITGGKNACLMFLDCTRRVRTVKIQSS